MMLSHKIALMPNNRQRTYFQKAAGTARFAYNWGLDEWNRQYREHKENPAVPAPNESALRRQLNNIKRERFPWMLEVTKNAPQIAIIQLGQAFTNFFKGKAKHPVFHKKGLHDSFTITNDQFRIKNKTIRIPCLGWVRMREALRFDGEIMSATVSRAADRWFVSIAVETQSAPAVIENQETVGVDLGISVLATLSTGEKIEGPKAHKALLNRQRRLSRSLSRKLEAAKAGVGLTPKQVIPKGKRIPLSRNAVKTKAKLSRLHARIANIRNDTMHKLTTGLTRRFGVIGIENLNVSGMMRTPKLSRSIADMGFFEFRRQLQYKAAMTGGIVVTADQWYPSSKTCSNCGYILPELSLGVRTWKCPVCRSVHDRDVNAAMNLKKMAVFSLAGSSPVTACGEKGSGLCFGISETGLSEAGIQQHKVPMDIFGYV